MKILGKRIDERRIEGMGGLDRTGPDFGNDVPYSRKHGGMSLEWFKISFIID